MTKKAFYDDLYARELATKVSASRPGQVETEATIFYPMGGGQPGDTGYLSTGDGQQLRIMDTRYSEDRNHIVHFLEDTEATVDPGTEVTLTLDWERRHRHMRMHTCLHLMCSVITDPVTGGSVGESQSRLDFDAQSEMMDKETLTARLNALIQQGIPVNVESITDEQLDTNPDLVRTMSVQPPRGSGTIRMIRVEGVDYQPCGGTHVTNTREIGEVVVSKIKSKGKQNKRVTVELVSP